MYSVIVVSLPAFALDMFMEGQTDAIETNTPLQISRVSTPR
jgi:hypothetical protein